jgi:hypothetical protein
MQFNSASLKYLRAIATTTCKGTKFRGRIPVCRLDTPGADIRKAAIAAWVGGAWREGTQRRRRAFKWIFLSVVAASAVLCASFDDRAQQSPAPVGDCPVETIANLARQSGIEAVRPRLGCKGCATP